MPGLPFPQAVGFGGTLGGPRAAVAPLGPRSADRGAPKLRPLPQALTWDSHKLGTGAAVPPPRPAPPASDLRFYP